MNVSWNAIGKLKIPRKAKMIFENIRGKKDGKENAACVLGFGTLVVQGLATSIDALSVGFTIAEYDLFLALVSSLVIALVTFSISFSGLVIGKKAGGRFTDKAEIFGGIIFGNIYIRKI